MLIYIVKLFMQRKDIRDLILKGQQDIVVEIYRKQGIEFTKEASLSLLLSQNTSAVEIYRIFSERVLYITSSDNKLRREDIVKVIKNGLNISLPSEVMNSQNFNKTISEYLESWDDCTVLYNELWDCLKFTGIDEHTIGIAWAAALHISI